MQILKPPSPNSIESELQAIRSIVKCLEPLNEDGRVRVLQYSLAHLGFVFGYTGKESLPIVSSEPKEPETNVKSTEGKSFPISLHK